MPTPLIFTLEITLVVDGAGTQQTFYFATRGFATKPTDTPVSQYFEPLIKNPGNLRSELFSGARVGGGVRPAFGEIELNNLTGELDDWVDYGVAAGRVVVRFGPLFGAYPAAFTTCYIGYAHALTVDTRSVKIKLRSRDYLLDKPVVTATFEGTGGLEGTGNTSTKKRLVFGEPGYIPLVPVNANSLIYFVQANAADVRALAGSAPPYYHVFDGGVQLTHGGYYATAAAMLSTAPSEGHAKIWADSGDGTSGMYQSSVGPVYVRLGSEPEGELRVVPLGYLLNTQSERIRQWRCADLCLRAGLSDVDSNFVELPGHYVPTAGNRVVEGDVTYAEVLNDVATFNHGVWGFDRLDRWFTSQILGPEETGDAADTVVYEFDQHNIKGFASAALPGQEAPVWQVNVSAGKSYPCPTLGAADPTVRDTLSRDPWQATFTGTNDDVRAANPGAVVAEVQIQGHECKDKATKQRWIDRYLYLFGRRSRLYTLTTERFSSVALAEALLAIDVAKKVTVTYPRFNCDAGVTMRVLTVTRDLQSRSITLGLWAGDAGPATSTLGGGSSSASNGGGTGVRAFTVGVQQMAAFTQRASSTVTPLAGGYQVQSFPAFTQVGSSTVTAAAGDPDFASVAALFHCDGANNSTTLTDSSSHADSKTLTSPFVISTAQSKWGGASLLWPNGASETAAASWTEISRYGRGSGQGYTVELWFWKSASTTSGGMLRIYSGSSIIWQLRATSSANGWEIVTRDTNVDAFTASAGSWHFIQTVVATDGTSITKVNGTTVQTTTDLGTWSTAKPVIDAGLDVASGTLHADDWRITPGVARAFAVPTAAFLDS